MSISNENIENFSSNHETVIGKFEQKLGSKDFLQPIDLINAGIFGSHTALRNALNKGLLPFIKVTSHRMLIPKDAVIDHLRKSFSAAK